ncbi:hypothetical protein PV08_05886 [Exophiala spinifera]|uniref:Phosphatidylinositol-specific phospholipase C X domain-containing protein n=1 Tax=Exophiala spinifera TaxID=91928 RepID=A0A0D1YLC1_9EURO|nr:uncharacterized protein PV08_05886 [Exophiala spinifera]KIW15836.1 hypothetical protein PV08_05886 [Exophiala spinifera]
MGLRSLLSTSLLSLLSLASAASVSSHSLSSRAQACNNSPDLCSKPYNSVVHLGAHDSPFVRDASTGFSTSGNQYYNTTVQLSAGVRLVSAQVHRTNSQWHLCHTSCELLDAGLLSDWLKTIKTWLDNNPNEVVTVLLVNSDNARPAELHAEFLDADIVDQAYVPSSITTPPETWPTLQEIIAGGKRLMTFVASWNLTDPELNATTSYMMDEFTFIFENPFDNTNSSDFTCEPDRPSSLKNNVQAAISSNRMPLVNHFLYSTGAFDIETPDVDKINVTNGAGNSVGSLGGTLSQCNSEYGRVPTFTLVDFFDQGPAIDSVDKLNGVTDPVGRVAPPPRDTKKSSSSLSQSTFAGVVQLGDDVRSGETPKLGAWIWAAGKWTFGGINLNGGGLLD